MIWHWFLTPIVSLQNALFGALPPWQITLGTGAGGPAGIDGGMLHFALLNCRQFDKFVPLHDGVLPLLVIALAVFVSLLGFKFFKFILSLIPGISAGG